MTIRGKKKDNKKKKLKAVYSSDHKHQSLLPPPSSSNDDRSHLPELFSLARLLQSLASPACSLLPQDMIPRASLQVPDADADADADADDGEIEEVEVEADVDADGRYDGMCTYHSCMYSSPS